MRRAEIKDINKIEYIIENAKKALKEDGIDQWQIGSMDRDFLCNQIIKGKSYVYEDKGEVKAYAYLSDDKESPYKDLDQDFNGENYITIHTFAVDIESREKGLGSRFMMEILKYGIYLNLDSLRIDTHHDNFRMRSLLNKYGFKKIGKILIDEEGKKKPRIAYELML
ncbi:GNAT family N-acetyltransferase [Anaerococcus sp. NML200537]|uniref:GNAT family N-acetyltransferase n=1 Tax=unclassified Anaerococcus TaxID=2614126 RepID=UPI000D0B4927|nr:MULTISPECIES: GNAT family N-acetyltransferase [unclassified Anaerococcus]MCW6701474.1 GNAT family N-acetyltransferase [Anaerococcus sp. NML200537]